MGNIQKSLRCFSTFLIKIWFFFIRRSDREFYRERKLPKNMTDGKFLERFGREERKSLEDEFVLVMVYHGRVLEQVNNQGG